MNKKMKNQLWQALIFKSLTRYEVNLRYQMDPINIERGCKSAIKTGKEEETGSDFEGVIVKSLNI